jgi:hypothetical protein
MTPTPEQIKALYIAASELCYQLGENGSIGRPYDNVAFTNVIEALTEFDDGTYNPNLNFGGWLPIEQMPESGEFIVRHEDHLWYEHVKAIDFGARLMRIRDGATFPKSHYQHFLPLPTTTGD